MKPTELQNLFHVLFSASKEEEIEKIIDKNPGIFKQENWIPLGQNNSNFGVIENQQSNSIAALIEKITNSIDAILTKKCLESGIDPKSSDAPKSMEQAIARFFPENKNWLTDLN